ncbi:MAG: HD domain-containing protein [Clostridia bacterium]|nr:HD domain-containing protein [Clostridia bacterium]
MSKGIYINDSIHGLIQLSEYEKRIISSIGFNRLHDVYQNSTVYLTFPSNRTKRFEHSLGTMKIASDMFYRSILNTSDEVLKDFYESFENKIIEVVESIKANSSICEIKLGGKSPKITNISELKITMDHMRYSLVPSNVPKDHIIIHCILIESIRVTALLHDVGHPPFSHIVENAIHNQYKKHSQNPDCNSRTKIFCETMKKFFEEGKKLHEEMGDEICKNILDKVVYGMSNEQYDVKRYHKNLYELIIANCVLRILKNEKLFENLHTLVDGALDSDRLDYVTRDSLNSGMDSGKIEYQRIINDMRLQTENKNFYFCVPQKAVNSVEDFAKRRLSIYKNIIYHHRVIKTDSLLQYSVEKIIDNFLGENSACKKDSDNVIPYDISGLWYPLEGNSTPTEKENALSQWNDSWLMTVLKQEYYSKYYQTEIDETSSEYVLAQQLTELLCNTKKYSSLIKRRDNFITIDNEFKKVLHSNKDKIIALIQEIQTLSKSIPDTTPLDKIINIEPTFDKIKYLVDFPNSDYSLALRYVLKNAGAFSTEISNMDEFFKEKVNETINLHFTNSDLCDIMIVLKRLSSGLEKPIYFYTPHDSTISTLYENSEICDIMTIEAESLPVFYVYLLLKSTVKFDDEERKILLQEIGKKIASDFAKHIINLLSKTKLEMESAKCAK